MIRASRRRLLPSQPNRSLSFGWKTALSSIPHGLDWFFHTWIISLVIYGLIVLGWIGNKYARRRLRFLVASRPNESICTFSRQLDYRRLDTLTIRAVFDELQIMMLGREETFPFRATDRFEEDLNIDGEDLDELSYEIARRCNRSMVQSEANPYFGSVKTLSDLVLFLNHQPKLA